MTATEKSLSVPDSAKTPTFAETRVQSRLLSTIGLIIGTLALGLAVIPSIAFEREISNPFESREEALRRKEGPPLKEGGVTMKLKSFEIRIGGKEIKHPAAPPNQGVTTDPVRWFTIVATILALIGIAVSAMAQSREKHTGMHISAIGCSVAAITWQFLVIGILLGVASVIVLFAIHVWFPK